MQHVSGVAAGEEEDVAVCAGPDHASGGHRVDQVDLQQWGQQERERERERGTLRSAVTGAHTATAVPHCET